MASLFFKYGAMGSAKTANLLMAAKNYDDQWKKVVVYKSSLDDRWGKDRIVSRSGVESRDCFVFPEGEKIYKEVKEMNKEEKLYCVFVDESQFLTKEQIIALSDIVDELSIPVICYGLVKTYKGELFSGSKHLFEMADKYEEVKTTCFFCNAKATHNARFLKGKQVKSGDDIVLGDIVADDDFYLPVCRKHFKKPDSEVIAKLIGTKK